MIALQREWYQKLADDGFEDIEYFDEQMQPRDILYKDGQKAFKGFKDSPGKYESTEQYYINARRFYWEHTFDSTLDKQIWFLHSEGQTSRAIEAQLKVSRPYVMKITNKYKALMSKALYSNQSSTNRST